MTRISCIQARRQRTPAFRNVRLNNVSACVSCISHFPPSSTSSPLFPPTGDTSNQTKTQPQKANSPSNPLNLEPIVKHAIHLPSYAAKAMPEPCLFNTAALAPSPSSHINPTLYLQPNPAHPALIPKKTSIINSPPIIPPQPRHAERKERRLLKAHNEPPSPSLTHLPM